MLKILLSIAIPSYSLVVCMEALACALPHLCMYMYVYVEFVNCEAHKMKNSLLYLCLAALLSLAWQCEADPNHSLAKHN